MDHRIFMRRCLQLASAELGNTSPNPMVGAVVVHKQQIIGEGWHHTAGSPHAEVNAINAVADKNLLKESTLYVSLEPCSHFGKTPPCSDLIIHHRIPRVVIATRDPFEAVNGKGIEKLKSAEVDVTEGIMQKEARHLNRRFFTFHTQKRPYIILKWAQTRDGFIDRIRHKGQSGINWITTPATRSLVHKWRSEEDAIMVGSQTVANDNPALTVRDVPGKQPLRVVLNYDQPLSSSAAVFDQQAPTLYFHTGVKNPAAGIEEIILKSETNALPQVLSALFERHIHSLMVEGGARLLQSFIDQNLWDEARVLTGRGYFGEGLPAPKLSVGPSEPQAFGQDHLTYYIR